MKLSAMAIIFPLIGGLLLVRGLRGVITKKPFVYPAYHDFWLYVAPCLGFIIAPIELAFDIEDNSFNPYMLLPILILLIWLPLFYWLRYGGYIAFGVSRESLQMALYSVLDTLNIPYIKSPPSWTPLTSIGAVLKTRVRMGTGELKIDPSRHRHTLRSIANNLDEHFRTGPNKINMTPAILCIAGGLLVIIGGVYLEVLNYESQQRRHLKQLHSRTVSRAPYQVPFPKMSEDRVARDAAANSQD